MGRLTAGEAKMQAAEIVLEVVARYAAPFVEAIRDEESRRLVQADVTRIEIQLRRQAIGSDKILGRQMTKELGRQVRAPKELAAQVEAMAKKAAGG